MKLLALLALLLPIACAGHGGPEGPDGPPNTRTIRSVPKILERDSENLRDVENWLVFEEDHIIFSVMWKRRGQPAPAPLDPQTEYEFTFHWLGWHIDVCEMLRVAKNGVTIWENPRPGSWR